jgi:hypothetical protein
MPDISTVVSQLQTALATAQAVSGASVVLPSGKVAPPAAPPIPLPAPPAPPAPVPAPMPVPVPLPIGSRVQIALGGTNWQSASVNLRSQWVQGGGDWLDKNGVFNGPTPCILVPITASPVTIDISGIDGDLLLRGIDSWSAPVIDGLPAQGFWTDSSDQRSIPLPQSWGLPATGFVLNPSRGHLLTIAATIGETLRIDKVAGPLIPTYPFIGPSNVADIVTLDLTSEAAIDAACGGSGNVSPPFAYDPEFSVDPINGLKVLRFDDHPGTGNQRLIDWFVQISPPRQAAHASWCMYIEDDVATGFNENGLKLPGLADHWATEETLSYRMEHGRPAPGNPGLYSYVSYFYDASSGSGFGNIFPIGNALLHAKQWYCMEQGIDLGTPGVADGSAAFWINGNKVFEITGRKMRNTAALLSIFDVNFYHGGMGFPIGPIHYRIAKIAVSSSYIGVPQELLGTLNADVNTVISQLQTALATAQSVAGASGVSPNGTLAPPAASITDAQFAVWTIGSAVPSAGTGLFQILKNGAWFAGGIGSTIAMDAVIKVLGTRNWFAPSGNSWTVTTAPPVAQPLPLPLPPPSPSGTYPAWRNAMIAKDTIYPIANTASMNGQDILPNSNATQNNPIDAWCALAADEHSLYSLLGRGHNAGNGNAWANNSSKFDMSVDVPRWQLVEVGSLLSAVTVYASSYLDRKPPSMHTYGYVHNSGDKIFVVGACATCGIGYPPGPNGEAPYQAGPEMRGFDKATNTWDAPGTWPNCPIAGAENMVACVDSRTGDIYIAREVRPHINKFTRATGTWSSSYILNPDQTAVFDPGDFRAHPHLIDAVRNRWIHFGPTHQEDGGHFFVQMIDLTTHVMTTAAITGALVTDGKTDTDEGCAICHDIDNDRYLTVQSRPAWPNYAIYAIDPKTLISTRIVDSVPGPAQNGQGVWDRLKYFQELGGVAYLPNYASNVLFMPTK